VELHTGVESGADAVEQMLGAEFQGRVLPGAIRQVAAEEVAAFASARVRTFIPIFAWRQARTRILAMLELEPSGSLSSLDAVGSSGRAMSRRHRSG
jgi:hypothetical protein